MVFSSHGRGGALGVEVRHLRPDRDEAGLDVEVAAELLPADLDVRAHDEVRPVRAAGRPAAALAPAPFEGEAAEHAGLARAGRRAAGGVPVARRRARGGRACSRSGARSRPSAGTRPCRSCSSSAHSAMSALGLGLHPGRHEGGEVEAGVAVEHELVVDDLVGRPRRHAPWPRV